MILLDTCTLLWLSADPPRLPLAVIEEIRRIAPGQRYLSAISAFEIGVKYSLGKLALPTKPNLWFDESCARRGLTTLPITREIAHRAAALPRHHRDPADRMIISTALEHGLTILTPDAAFRQYGVTLLWN